MNLKEKIKQWLLDGKTNEEIAELVLKEQGAADTKMTAIEIAELIYEAKQLADVSEELQKRKDAAEAAERAKKQDASFSEKIKDGVKDFLKSINYNPAHYAQPTTLKRFDLRKGTIVDTIQPNDAYKTFNSMFYAMLRKDWASAGRMSDEIDKYNDELHAKMGLKATPSVSDVTTRGGHAIPTEVNSEILQLIYQGSVILPLCNRDNVMVNSKIYPTMSQLTVAYIADQSTAASELNPTFSNPTVNMYRVGGFSALSNTLIMQKGADVVNAFVSNYANSYARFLDLHLIAGNITGASDLQDGLIWDANTTAETAIALSALSTATFADMEESIDASVNQASLRWVGNRLVRNRVRQLENTAGNYTFQNAMTGAPMEPLGIPFVCNPQIGSALQVAGDNRTGGSDNVLLLVDFSKFCVGLDGETRIDTSDHFLFTSDAMVMRAIKHVGWKLLFSNTARVKPLTNA